MSYITTKACKCDQCGHVWLSAKPTPSHCAKCKSRQWNAGTTKQATQA